MKTLINLLIRIGSFWKQPAQSTTLSPAEVGVSTNLKWILPTLTYLLTLGTGIWLGIVIQKRQIHRYQQLAEKAAKREQSLLDSLHHSSSIASKDHTIALQDETILNLRQRLRSDSIAHFTELEAIRAINQYLKSKK